MCRRISSLFLVAAVYYNELLRCFVCCCCRHHIVTPSFAGFCIPWSIANKLLFQTAAAAAAAAGNIPATGSSPTYISVQQQHTSGNRPRGSKSFGASYKQFLVQH